MLAPDPSTTNDLTKDRVGVYANRGMIIKEDRFALLSRTFVIGCEDSRL
jgi:hypothetical protein